LLVQSLNMADEDNMIFANDEDVCMFCAKEYMQENNVNISKANMKLKGHINGHKCLKLPFPGLRGVICKEHIDKAYEVLNCG